MVVAALVAAACGPRGAAPWPGGEAGRSRGPGPAVGARDRGTPAAAAGRLDAAIAAGDAPAIVAAAADVGALGGDLAPRRAEVHAAIDALDEAALEAGYAAADPAREPAGALALRRALVAHHAGDPAAAAAWLARADAADDAGAPALAARAAALRAEVTAADPRVVAVLLPLSGRFAAIGDELRAAIELAPRDGATLVILDTGGDPAGAAAAVEQAAARGAVAILGPVGAREGLAAARRAAELGIPIGLLAADDGADPDAGVFRLVGSPADEARAAARLAAAEAYPTAAVLAPRDDVGAEMARAFAEEAAALGVHVARIGAYDPTASDLLPDVKAFLGLDPATNSRLAAHLRRHGKKGWQTFSPDVDFSLLYVPDAHDRAALLVAFLPYVGVELRTEEMPDPVALARKHGGRIPQVVQLLGGGGWNHPGLITRGGATVEGALIVDACAGALDPHGPSGEVAARLRAATGRDPGAGALAAYDAARLVLGARAAAAARGGPPREAMRVALAAARIDEGACPAARIGPDGELARDAVVIAVEGGELVLVSW